MDYFGEEIGEEIMGGFGGDEVGQLDIGPLPQ
jgi:hypothetical protein